MGHGARAITDANPENVTISFDLRNAFQHASRKRTLERLYLALRDPEMKNLAPLVRHAIWTLNRTAEITFTLSDGTSKIVYMDNGFHQGGPLSSCLFGISFQLVIEDFQKTLGVPLKDQTAMLNFHDDLIANAPIGQLEKVVTTFTDVVEQHGHSSNRDKLTVYSRASSATAIASLNDAATKVGIKWETLADDERGITACGANIGTPAFEKKKLEGIATRIEESIGMLNRIVSTLKDLQMLNKPIFRCRQGLSVILRLCMASRFGYFTRVHDPRIAGPIASRIDEYILQTFMAITDISPSESNIGTPNVFRNNLNVSFASAGAQLEALRIQLQLPINKAGFGLVPIGGNHCRANYAASFSESINSISLRVSLHVLDHAVGAPAPAGANHVPLSFRPTITAAVLAALEPLSSNFKTLTDAVREIINNPGSDNRPTKMAADFAEAFAEAGFNRLFLMMPNAREQQRLLGAAGFSQSAWLEAIPSPWYSMQDTLWVQAIRNRGFMCATNEDGQVPCAACHSQLGPSPTKTAPIFNAAHAETCPRIGFYGPHTGVAKALHEMVKKLENRHEGRVKTELERHYASVPGLLPIVVPMSSSAGMVTAPIVRADVAVTYTDEKGKKEILLLDIVIVRHEAQLLLLPTTTPNAKRAPGHRAEIADAKKVKDFKEAFTNADPAHVIFSGFPIESTGFLGPTAETFINKIAAIEASLNDMPYNRRPLVEKISMAMQEGLARHAIDATTLHLKLLPAYKLSVASAAAANGGTGPASGGAFETGQTLPSTTIASNAATNIASTNNPASHQFTTLHATAPLSLPLLSFSPLSPLTGNIWSNSSNSGNASGIGNFPRANTSPSLPSSMSNLTIAAGNLQSLSATGNSANASPQGAARSVA